MKPTVSMRFTRQISDGFLARKALTYWRNLISNYDENVSERDFFDYFARCDASGEAIRKIRALYTKEQLEKSVMASLGMSHPAMSPRRSTNCGMTGGIGERQGRSSFPLWIGGCRR